MFRQLLAYILRKDLGDAQVVYGILQNSYPEVEAGSGYARLARAFWEAYEPAQDGAAGCLAAEAFAGAHPAEVLAPLDYGYANRIYTPDDLCPPLP
jgi:hypothetical protein